MKLIETWQEGAEQALASLFRARLRGPELLRRAMELVPVLTSIEEFGDEALLGLVAAGQSDEGDAKARGIALPLPDAPTPLSLAELEALSRVRERVTRYYEGQVPRSWFFTGKDGELFGQQVVPLRSIGVCMPDAPFSPGLLQLLLMPARILGITDVSVNFARAPVGRSLELAAHILREAGVRRSYALPEEAAVLAFAVGRGSVPRVDKVVGVGGEQAQAAALLVAGDVPSKLGPVGGEAVILADGSASGPCVALDLMGHWELGPMDLVAVITPSMVVANEVTEEMSRLRTAAPVRGTASKRQAGQQTTVILTRTMDEAVELINRLQPLSVTLQVEDPLEILPSIQGPGVIHLGAFDPPVLDRAFPLAVLPGPAGDAGRRLSPVELTDYFKRSPIVYRSRRSLKTLIPLVEAVSDTQADSIALQGLARRPDGSAT